MVLILIGIEHHLSILGTLKLVMQFLLLVMLTKVKNPLALLINHTPICISYCFCSFTMRIFFQKPKTVPYHQANKDKRPAESQHCCLQQCQWQLIQLICVVCVKYKAEPNSMKLKKIDSRWERKVLCIYFRLWKYFYNVLRDI